MFDDLLDKLHAFAQIFRYLVITGVVFVLALIILVDWGALAALSISVAVFKHLNAV